MSGVETVSILGGVGLMIMLPVLAIIGVYIMGRQSRHKYQTLIELDGARCVQTMDGKVIITPKTWQNAAILIFFVVILGLCGVLMAESLIQDLSTSAVWQAIALAFSLLTIVSVIIYLARALRKPAFYFDPARQALDIRQGRTTQRIPFAQMDQLFIEGYQTDTQAGASLPGAGVKLGLTTGEVIELGTLSSVTGGKDVWQRSAAICRLIANVTGVALPPELQSDTP